MAMSYRDVQVQHFPDSPKYIRYQDWAGLYCNKATWCSLTACIEVDADVGTSIDTLTTQVEWIPFPIRVSKGRIALVDEPDKVHDERRAPHLEDDIRRVVS